MHVDIFRTKSCIVCTSLQVAIVDPSQVYRPEDVFKEYNDLIVSRTDKCEKDFRNYEVNLQTDQVRKTYTLMHENQTMDFVKRKVSGVLINN